MNFLSFVALLLQLSFFGIFVAFNPMLLLSELLIVLRSKRPILHSAVFLAGVSLPLIIIATIGAVIYNEDTTVHPFNSSIKLSPVLNILIGVILLLVSLRLFIIKQPTKPKKNSTHTLTQQLSYLPLFWFAFFRSAVSFTSILGIIAATKVLKEYTDNYLVILLGLFWTISIGMLPFLGILGYSVKRPENIKTIEQRIDPIMNKDYSGSVKWLILVAGLYFIVKATITLKT